MCNLGSCKDCKNLVVLKEGGYLWGQYGDIVGMYDESEPRPCSECGDLHTNLPGFRCNHCNGYNDAIFDAKWEEYIALEKAGKLK